MNVWIVLISMAAGGMISEMYHARMWQRYQQGMREGRQRSEESRGRIEIHHR